MFQKDWKAVFSYLPVHALTGGPEWIRTIDLSDVNGTLCQAELRVRACRASNLIIGKLHNRNNLEFRTNLLRVGPFWER